MEQRGKCILVCAGELGMETIPIEKEDFVIAVDGGLGYCTALRIEPNLILGDFDSVGEREAETIASLQTQDSRRLVRLPREKDDTDTIAALKEGLRRGYTEFRIYGGMGGRFDHTFANIQSLLFLRNQGARGCLADSVGEMHILKDEKICFPRGRKGILSLFSLVEESRGVTIEGMKYLLDQATVRNDFPVGISNEFIGEEASVAVEQGTLVCVIINEEN